MNDNNRKVVNVVAAVIFNEEGRVLAVQRGYGDIAGGWEFPGGKIEPGESPQLALQREIYEELEAYVIVHELITTVEWNYPTFHLSMQCYRCTLGGPKIILHEHTAMRWLRADQLDEMAWLPADVIVAEQIKNFMQ